MRNGNLLKSRVSEIRVKQIRVNQVLLQVDIYERELQIHYLIPNMFCTLCKPGIVLKIENKQSDAILQLE